LLFPSLPDVDIPVKILELNLRAAAVDGAADGLIHLHHVPSALGPSVFHGGLGGGRLQLNVEVGIDLAVVGAHAEIGFEVRREGNVDGPVHGAESHGLLCVHAVECNQHASVQGVGHGAAGDAFQHHLAVDVVHIQVAIYAGDGYIA